MKIIITHEEKEALEKTTEFINNYDACRYFSKKTGDCKKCILNKFDIFNICFCDGSKNQMKIKSKEILAVAEVEK